MLRVRGQESNYRFRKVVPHLRAEATVSAGVELLHTGQEVVTPSGACAVRCLQEALQKAVWPRAELDTAPFSFRRTQKQFPKKQLVGKKSQTQDKVK